MRNFLRAVIVSSLMINFSQSRRLGIIGGEVANIQDSPYQVAFLVNGKLKCGGSIICDNCVLTAGHCVTPELNVSSVTVRVGSSLKDKGGQVIAIEEIIPHPRFDSAKLIFDFAIVKLKTLIKFDKNAQPIELPEDNETLPVGTQCKVCGWGKMENDVKPRQLRCVLVNLVNRDKCQENYNTTLVKFRIHESMLCASVPEGQKDACSGDSGGPFVCNGKLFGDVSSGYGCGLKEYPGIYGRLSIAGEFIRQTCKCQT